MIKKFLEYKNNDYYEITHQDSITLFGLDHKCRSLSKSDFKSNNDYENFLMISLKIDKLDELEFNYIKDVFGHNHDIKYTKKVDVYKSSIDIFKYTGVWTIPPILLCSICKFTDSYLLILYKGKYTGDSSYYKCNQLKGLKKCILDKVV